MTYQDYTIVGEPRGTTLASLLRESTRFCDHFLFALTDMVLSLEGQRVLEVLAPFLINCGEAKEYPAGTLPWGTIRICRYSMTSESAQLLEAATDHLFGWQEPDLPNDLCLMRGDDPWLITMSNERRAVLVLNADQLDEIRAAIPRLRFAEQTQGSPSGRSE
jgi:hypothetical protein